MKQKVKKLLKTYRWAGLTEQEFALCSGVIADRNAATLGWVLPLVLHALAALTILSLIPGTGEEPNRILYLVYLSLVFAQDMLFRFYGCNHPEKSLHLSYLLMLTAYSFGIVTATCIGASSSITVFCVFLISTPLLVIDTPMRLAHFTVVMEEALLVVNWLVPNPSPDRFLVTESLFCAGLGLGCCYVIQHTKLRDMLSRLTLEAQRDTDMMTGAGSRVAYIRELERLHSTDTPLGIVYVDVNDLKQTNDRQGHEFGDRLIRDAFALMNDHFHSDNDRIYRIGGDEFVIVSTGVDRESFLSAFRAMSRVDECRSIISCGCTWTDSALKSEIAVREAEQQMYAAKQSYYSSHPENDRRIR